jgi:ATP:ADP antiporter, AAA family
VGHRIIKALWGDLRGEELKKFSLLSLGFFFLIGSYWPLKSIKDSVFLGMVGSNYQPYAKIASLIFFFPLVLAYSKLIDHFSKEKMIYMMISIYGTIGFIFVYLLAHPVYGIGNTARSPYRLVGWGFYLFIESFISLMVSLYWAFINDVTTPESAKKGYGMIIFGTQLGGVLFTLVGTALSSNTEKFATRIPLIVLACVIMFFFIGIIIFLLTHFVSKKEFIGYESHKQKDKPLKETSSKVSFLDGFKLLISKPYVGGIFGLVFFHETISALMHYQMLVMIDTTFINNIGAMNKYIFNFHLIIQAVACLFGLFGTSFFQRKFGIRFCLIAYPLFLGLFIIAYLFSPTLFVITGVMIVAKAINYAFNQPAKEALYIPTSRAVKYKSKAWIDMFGLRSAKGFGASVNKVIGTLAKTSSVVSLGIIVVWTVLAGTIGKMHKKVITENKLIS